MGTERLQGALQRANGDPARLDAGALHSVAQEADAQYVQALSHGEVPPGFDDAHHYLVSALGIRARATQQLAEGAGDAERFEGTLATAVEDLRLSDGIVRNHYLPEDRKSTRLNSS